MEITFCSKQISKRGNFDANLVLWQYKLDLMSWFMEPKSFNLKLKQDQITK